MKPVLAQETALAVQIIDEKFLASVSLAEALKFYKRQSGIPLLRMVAKTYMVRWFTIRLRTCGVG